MRIPIEQAQRELLRLLERVAGGEEMVITRDGRPVARIVPDHTPQTNGAAGDQPKGRVGWGKDLIKSVSADFDAPLDEFREYTK
jgi:prevent-host-death family protein